MEEKELEEFVSFAGVLGKVRLEDAGEGDGGGEGGDVSEGGRGEFGDIMADDEDFFARLRPPPVSMCRHPTVWNANSLAFRKFPVSEPPHSLLPVWGQSV